MSTPTSQGSLKRTSRREGGRRSSGAFASPGSTTRTTRNEELSSFVEEMLASMNRKFQSVEQSIQSKMNVMGTQLDELEGSIEDLLQQAGLNDDNYDDDDDDDSLEHDNDTTTSGHSRKSLLRLKKKQSAGASSGSRRSSGVC